MNASQGWSLILDDCTQQHIATAAYATTSVETPLSSQTPLFPQLFQSQSYSDNPPILSQFQQSFPSSNCSTTCSGTRQLVTKSTNINEDDPLIAKNKSSESCDTLTERRMLHRRPIVGNLESIRDVVESVLEGEMKERDCPSSPKLNIGTKRPHAAIDVHHIPHQTPHPTRTSSQLEQPWTPPQTDPSSSENQVDQPSTQTLVGLEELGLPSLEADEGLRVWIQQQLLDPEFSVFVERVERLLGGVL